VRGACAWAHRQTTRFSIDRDPTTLLDPIKKTFDPVAGAVEIRAEADWIVAIAFRG